LQRLSGQPAPNLPPYTATADSLAADSLLVSQAMTHDTVYGNMAQSNEEQRHRRPIITASRLKRPSAKRDKP
jgi:hypothetical protein